MQSIIVFYNAGTEETAGFLALNPDTSEPFMTTTKTCALRFDVASDYIKQLAEKSVAGRSLSWRSVRADIEPIG